MLLEVLKSSVRISIDCRLSVVVEGLLAANLNCSIEGSDDCIEYSIYQAGVSLVTRYPSRQASSQTDAIHARISSMLFSQLCELLTRALKIASTGKGRTCAKLSPPSLIAMISELAQTVDNYDESILKSCEPFCFHRLYRYCLKFAIAQGSDGGED